MPSIVTYNTLIKGLCDMGKAQEAMQLLGKMSDFGGCCKPNVITYSIVIDGPCRDESVDCALLLFAKMTKQYIKPDVYTYNSVIHSLLSADKWEETMKLSSEMEEKGVVADCVT